MFGRKTKLNPEIQKEIGNNIKLGMPIKYAAEAAGISEVCFYNWYNKGESAKSGPFFEFYAYINECKAVSVQLHLKLITKAASDGNWQASAWILERRHPDEFGRKERLDLKADVDAKVSGGVVIYIPEDGRDSEPESN